MACLIHSDVCVKGTKTRSHLKSDIYALEFLMSHHVSRVCGHRDPPVYPLQQLGCRGPRVVRVDTGSGASALASINRDAWGEEMADLCL